MGIFNKLFGPTKRQRELAAKEEAEREARLRRKQEDDRRWRMNKDATAKQDALHAERRRKEVADAQNAAVSAPYGSQSSWSNAAVWPEPFPSSIQSFTPSHHTPAVSGGGGTFDGGGSSGGYGSSSPSSSDSGSSDSGSSGGDSSGGDSGGGGGGGD